MRRYVTLPNLVTSGSLSAGFLALLVAASNVGLATVLVLLAALLDWVDGALARRSACDHTFGSELDSLADLVCFGVVPAYTLYRVLLGELGVIGLLGCLAFLLAGAWRLARFPLVQRTEHFVGLPIPAAGILTMLLAMWCPEAVPALLAAAVLSALMVSTVPFPTVGALARGVIPDRSATQRPRPAGRRHRIPQSRVGRRWERRRRTGRLRVGRDRWGSRLASRRAGRSRST